MKPVPAGEGVSYGHTHTTTADTRLGLLPVGYGDGIPRHASNVGPMLVAGRRNQVAGRVCMDQVVVDLGDAPVEVGDEAVLFGPGDARGADSAGLGGRGGHHLLRDRHAHRRARGAALSRRDRVNPAQRAGLAGAALVATAAGAAAGAAAERLLVRRPLRRRAPVKQLGLGQLRGPHQLVVADDGVQLYVEVDEPRATSQVGQPHGGLQPRLRAEPRLLPLPAGCAARAGAAGVLRPAVARSLRPVLPAAARPSVSSAATCVA